MNIMQKPCALRMGSHFVGGLEGHSEGDLKHFRPISPVPPPHGSVPENISITQRCMKELDKMKEDTPIDTPPTEADELKNEDELLNDVVNTRPRNSLVKGVSVDVPRLAVTKLNLKELYERNFDDEAHPSLTITSMSAKGPKRADTFYQDIMEAKDLLKVRLVRQSTKECLFVNENGNQTDSGKNDSMDNFSENAKESGMVQNSNTAVFQGGNNAVECYDDTNNEKLKEDKVINKQKLNDDNGLNINNSNEKSNDCHSNDFFENKINGNLNNYTYDHEIETQTENFINEENLNNKNIPNKYSDNIKHVDISANNCIESGEETVCNETANGEINAENKENEFTGSQFTQNAFSNSVESEALEENYDELLNDVTRITMDDVTKRKRNKVLETIYSENIDDCDECFLNVTEQIKYNEKMSGIYDNRDFIYVLQGAEFNEGEAHLLLENEHDSGEQIQNLSPAGDTGPVLNNEANNQNNEEHHSEESEDNDNEQYSENTLDNSHMSGATYTKNEDDILAESFPDMENTLKSEIETVQSLEADVDKAKTHVFVQTENTNAEHEPIQYEDSSSDSEEYSYSDDFAYSENDECKKETKAETPPPPVEYLGSKTDKTPKSSKRNRCRSDKDSKHSEQHKKFMSKDVSTHKIEYHSIPRTRNSSAHSSINNQPVVVKQKANVQVKNEETIHLSPKSKRHLSVPTQLKAEALWHENVLKILLRGPKNKLPPLDSYKCGDTPTLPVDVELTFIPQPVKVQHKPKPPPKPSTASSMASNRPLRRPHIAFNRTKEHGLPSVHLAEIDRNVIANRAVGPGFITQLSPTKEPRVTLSQMLSLPRVQQGQASMTSYNPMTNTSYQTLGPKYSLKSYKYDNL